MADPNVEQIHFIGKDIVTFHTLFWPAMLHFSGKHQADGTYVPRKVRAASTCTASSRSAATR